MEYTNKNGQKYFLHTTVVTLNRNQRQQTIYYFAKKQDTKRASELPQGFQVVENTRTGLPVVKRLHA